LPAFFPVSRVVVPTAGLTRQESRNRLPAYRRCRFRSHPFDVSI